MRGEFLTWEKRCAQCRTEKMTDQFSRNRARSDGLDHLCRTCRAGWNKLQRQSKLRPTVRGELHATWMGAAPDGLVVALLPGRERGISLRELDQLQEAPAPRSRPASARLHGVLRA